MLILSPLLTAALSADNIIPNQYIVVLHDNLPKDAIEAHHSWVIGLHNAGTLPRGIGDGPFTGIKYKWDGELDAYAGHFSERMIAAIRNTPEVCLSVPTLHKQTLSFARR